MFAPLSQAMHLRCKIITRFDNVLVIPCRSDLPIHHLLPRRHALSENGDVTLLLVTLCGLEVLHGAGYDKVDVVADELDEAL
jgi:hypothetical protein